jgi:hypothetical protein
MNPATAIPVLARANEPLRFDRIADLREHLLASYGPPGTWEEEEREELQPYFSILDAMEAKEEERGSP